MIRNVMAALEYPQDRDVRQSAVWFPLLPESSYDDDKFLNCSSFLIHKNGLPKLLLCPTEEKETYNRLALDRQVFSEPPPYFVTYQGEDLSANRLTGNQYVKEEKIPSWNELDGVSCGCLSKERADAEVVAVRENVARWLKISYSRKAVERLMSIHTQRAGIVKELIQNACDCLATKIQFSLKDNTLTFRHDGHPFMPTNVHAITALNFSCKPPDAIGYKGIGFKAIYQVCRRPQVSSGPFRFAFEPVPEYSNAGASKLLSPYLPVVDHNIPIAQQGWTEFSFPLELNCEDGIAEVLNKLDSTLMLFVAGKGMSLRRLSLPGRVIELIGDLSNPGGIVSIIENDSPKKWLYVRHSFIINQDRESAVTDFANATGRDDLETPLKEEIVIVVPLTLSNNGVMTPIDNHNGRFHSFMPTLDEYQWRWDINANFLLDEQRDHLRPPDKGSWNEALLDECGQALLQLLDEVISISKINHDFPMVSFYNVIPNWDEACDAAQVGQYFKIMHNNFSLHFADKDRAPIQADGGFDIASVLKTIWIEQQFFPLFPTKVWSRLIPNGYNVANLNLNEEIWKPILCENCAVQIFDGPTLAKQLEEKDWVSRLGFELNSADMVPLVGRLCCYLGEQGVTSEEVKEVELVLDSNRVLHRPNDRPDDKTMCRMLEDEFTALPEYVSKEIVFTHDGVMRFLQRDPSYFKGSFAEGLTDNQRIEGRRFWTALTDTLDISTVIATWLNPAFTPHQDNTPNILQKRFEWVQFLFENREKIQRKGLLKDLRIRLLARVGDQEVWKPAQEVWLFGACPQGWDVETFIGDTPGVPVLSKKHAEAIGGGAEIDEASLGTFFSKIGVKSSITSITKYLGNFSPLSQDGRENFCNTLGIQVDRMPIGNINQNMVVRDYDLHPDVISAFTNTIDQSGNFVHRSVRLRSFVKLLEQNWPELKKFTKKEGFCHFYGAQVDTVVPGGSSIWANMLCNTAWVPLANDSRTLKQPRETCNLTETNLQLANLSQVGNYSDLDFENLDLVTFLGFGEIPKGLTTLDAIRGLCLNWSKLENPKAEFDILYSKLAAELDSEVDLEIAIKVFHDEPLLFLPTKPAIFRKSNEVLCGADSRFEGFLEDLTDFYPSTLYGLFKRLGVASQVEEIHYLRYLVEYIWKKQPSIDERRRILIQKAYRQLINWAQSIPTGQGVWVLPEGKAFNESLLFYGRCQGNPGWYSGHDKTIVFRDEPQIEASLLESDKYVLESFLAQLRRTEEGLEPFLRLFNVRSASQLAVRKVRPDPGPVLLPTASNFRQNLSRLTDILGSGLKKQHIEEEFREDAQSQIYFDKASAMHNLASVSELFGCEVLQVIITETLTGREKSVSCDASLDFGDGHANAFISGSICGQVGSQLAREFKNWMRTDTLPEPSRIPIDRVIEDISSWLDKSPDRFEERLQRILARHIPSLTTIVEVPDNIVVDHEKGEEPGEEKVRPAAGKGNQTEPPEGDKPTRVLEGEGQKSQLPIMPELESQAVVFVGRTPEEFLVFTKQGQQGAGSGNRPHKPVNNLTDQQRGEIGRRGELIVLEQEINRLQKAGRPDLAEKVVDRNQVGYDPYGPYDIDSYTQDDGGEWKSVMIEVKSHLDADTYWFDMSEAELRLALVKSSTPYLLYLVLNLSGHDVRVEMFDFRLLWNENRLHYQTRSLRINMRPKLLHL